MCKNLDEERIDGGKLFDEIIYYIPVWYCTSRLYSNSKVQYLYTSPVYCVAMVCACTVCLASWPYTW